MPDLAALRTAVRSADAAVARALYQNIAAPNATTAVTLANARQAARASRTALNAALAAAFPTGADPAAGLRGDLPIVLFPLRLETRFLRAAPASSGSGRATPVAATGEAPLGGASGQAATTTLSDIAISALPVGTLQIRVYPDEILAQTHEPELTDDEWQAGRAYWTAGDSLASWAALLARFPAPRAAWIVTQTNTTTRAPARAASWTRPAIAVLPDRFAAFAYRGDTLVTSTVGAPVVEPLTLTLSPSIDATQRVPLPGSSQQIDQDLLWTVDFAAAKAAGMGLELTLSAVDWSQGFDLLLVVGTKGSFSIDEASQQIEALLDGHHYTRGLALVPPGTPTSNSAAAPSGYPPVDPGGTRSFAVERETPASGDGLLLANALGVSAAAVAHLDQTGLSADTVAQAMMTALWPATLGYHLEQMMAPNDAAAPPPFDANAIAAAYEYTRASVRPGGPLPAIRVGAVPYSVLPATSLTRLAAATPGPLATALAALRPTLVQASDKAPRVNPDSSDPDTDLVNVLRLNASSTAFQVQVLIGAQFQLLIGKLRGTNSTETKLALERLARRTATAIALLRSANLPATNAPRIALASFGASDTFAGVLVSSQADQQAPLADSANYIKWIMGELSSGGAALTSDSLPAAYERTLLYQLLRHAVLVEKSRTAQPGIREVEVLGLVATATTTASAPTTATTAIDKTAIDTTVVATFGSAASSTPPPPPPISHLADVTTALGVLAGVPVADLERLLTETLDLCSHRFDAWITSLATARLKQVRGASGPVAASHYGAYGWVQNLKPQAAPFDPGPGGFIHAPSPNHAQAAAILRNGFLARGAGETNLYAIDLSSARMRAGLALLARIRDGESLSEILGTEIETRLRANPTLATTFLEALRTGYPMPSSPIVDGLAAVLAWRSAPTSPHFPSTILSDVSQLLDAAADLLTAESIFQMVRGNPAGAAAGLDALGQGARPPEPQIAHAPIAGSAVSHRVAVVLDDTPPPAWAATPTPRASVNRYLDGWLGQLLGDPQRVKCQVKTASGTQIVTLAELELRPIDVVVLSEAPLDGTAEIEARIRAKSGDPAATISYTADPSWGQDAVTFPALIEFSRALDKLISLARPLTASDLALPADAVADLPDPDLTARAQGAVAALAALDFSKPATQVAQLRQAALFGLAGAYVAANASAADVAAAAQRADAERQTRLHEVQATTDPSEIVRSVFARSFPLLGRFAVPPAVAPALAGPSGLAADDVERWVHKAARARPGLERWRRSRLFAQALGAPTVLWEVVQLPYAPTATWCGLAFASRAAPPSGTLSAVLHRPWKTAPSAGWAGLLVEEWSELIPSDVQQTGIAFNYPSPRAEAPQALLVAVPPANAAAWSTSVLADVVRETFDLARLRLLTPDLLTSYASLLPATSLSVNTGADTLSTNLWIAVIEPIQLVAAGG